MIGLKPITGIYYTLIGSSTLSTLRDTLLNSFLIEDYTTLLLGLALVFFYIVERFYLFFKALYYYIILYYSIIIYLSILDIFIVKLF